MVDNNQLSGVSRTMLLTLRARAEESSRAGALFRDPQAADWFQALPWDADLEAWYDANSQSFINIRTKLLDNIAVKHIATRPNSLVVELGGGLSSRYYRVGEKASYWIELDLPAVIEIRRQLDLATSEHRFLATSVLDWDWMEEIPDVPPEDILFIAEGLFYYFEESEVKQLVQKLRERFARATLALDVGGTSFKRYNSEKAARVGAPMKWFVTDERDVTALGVSLIEVWSLIGCYRDRWSCTPWEDWLIPLFLPVLPNLRNFCLVLETRLEPVDGAD